MAQQTILTIPNFSLRDTLLCGQCFRWEELPDGSFSGFAGSHFASVLQSGDQVFITSDADAAFWEAYFDCDTDYEAAKKRLSRYRAMRRPIERAGGIRLLRQDPWEALCSFIISQNNNIPRIKGIISRLCEAFGEAVPGGYAFPAAERLAACTLDDLAPLRAGFRGKYLLDAAQRVNDGRVVLDRIAASSTEEGEAELIQIFGVGVKVAQCVLLYGFHKLDAFPVDVWMKKVLALHFPNGFPKQAKKDRGIAQQFLFHDIRSFPDQQ